VPLNYVHSSIEGVTIFNPFPLRKFDLIHAFNRIPIGLVPFVIGFESHLPRVFGREVWKIFAVLSKMLAGKRCRKFVAISQIAHRQFLQQHNGKPWFDDVASKLTVRYPNILIPLNWMASQHHKLKRSGWSSWAINLCGRAVWLPCA
jgi:hypothetical protein